MKIQPRLIGGVGIKDSNNGTQYKQQNRIYSAQTVSIAVTRDFRPYYLILDDIYKNRNVRIYKETAPTLRTYHCQDLKVFQYEKDSCIK